jgi:hypothetical protein
MNNPTLIINCLVHKCQKLNNEYGPFLVQQLIAKLGKLEIFTEFEQIAPGRSKCGIQNPSYLP